MIWLAAAAAVLLLGVWWAFPTVARILGFLIVLDSLLSIVLFPAQALPYRLWWLLLGLVVWLAGHWAWAFRHGVWASRIALRIFELPGLRYTIAHSTRTAAPRRAR
ncbi:hypothetical protein IU500_19180 [Nocardia terpenica]|uniref:hypothetical protein n=1 Tax=Nocardia terpenica TaxID=455432 RepID=UPI0018936113|nr:hypothetical protein [Nocardia terpenica]MBF6062037.1 hypothetical protein [Nocardia terpenica]MBF6106163.1 hypothetical protein [Nocardia terpenica]MBF6110457.1 hypothetical protein [Nocardia terpenica]MBF6120706.1 hypothetical protein [Nocardia terpenica]MBF6151793.1 hypothetical protein [Nocardia terpenica]